MMKLGILGCGNMGKAYLLSLINNNIFAPSEIIVCNRTEAKNFLLQQEFGVHTTTNPQNLENTEIIILGVKPQGLAELIFNPQKNSILISLLVGTTVDTLQKKFAQSHIVRFMPNVGQYSALGITGVYTPIDSLSDKEESKRGLINTIASAGAKAIWLDKEDNINHIAAISGSGPAYFFAFAEALQSAAQNLGFDKKTSQDLALQTFIGAAEYVKQHCQNISLQADVSENTDIFTNCIATVASKGGTTQAALKTFAEKNLNNLVHKSVVSAVKRGAVLAGK